MAVVDRNILRLAVYEMSRNEVPAPVIIDEALELARQFSNDESISFINGVLDAVRKQAIETQVKKQASGSAES
jgi:transcription antitermination protein NusB